MEVLKERRDFLLAKSDQKKMVASAHQFMKRYRFRKDPRNQKALNELADEETLLNWESGTQFMGDDALVDRLIAKAEDLILSRNHVSQYDSKKELQSRVISVQQSDVNLDADGAQIVYPIKRRKTVTSARKASKLPMGQALMSRFAPIECYGVCTKLGNHNKA
jgi:hypothetical protein